MNWRPAAVPRASEFLASFQAAPDIPALPESIAGRYQMDSVLGHDTESGTYLVRRTEDGGLFVLKTGGGGQDLAEEFRLLGRLPQGLAPEPEAFLEEDGVQYLLRAYLPGRPLAEAWEAGASFGRWADLGARLCGLLAGLHSLEPPVVHRDIKPENIILSPEGRPYLIDFGIARSVKPDQETDTVRLGTRTTAAPEQYGFAQTDQRTDLYAMGVTLRWMATGSYRPEALDSARCPAWAERFLRKAAAFDPARRFRSAEAMARALRRHTAPERNRRRLLILTACAVMLAGLALWSAGRRRAVDFGSPLLEAAVRAELGKPEGRITRKDLEEVRRLAVVGTGLLGAEQDYDYSLCSYVDRKIMRGQPCGDISDLSPLADMSSLETLYLCQQEIDDLSPLEGLPLRELYLCDNAVRDLSPLEGLTELEVLYLGGNPLEDLSPLASLTNLRELNLDFWDGRELESLEPLRGLPLEELSMGNVTVLDGGWGPLSALDHMRSIFLWSPPPEALAALERCAGLRELKLGNYQAADLTGLPVLPGMSSLAVFDGLPSIEGVQKQSGIRWLSLCNQENVDLAPAAELPALEELYLFHVSVPSFAPLLDASELRRVDVDGEAVREAVEAGCPGHAFEITVS